MAFFAVFARVEAVVAFLGVGGFTAFLGASALAAFFGPSAFAALFGPSGRALFSVPPPLLFGPPAVFFAEDFRTLRFA